MRYCVSNIDVYTGLSSEYVRTEALLNLQTADQIDRRCHISGGLRHSVVATCFWLIEGVATRLACQLLYMIFIWKNEACINRRSSKAEVISEVRTIT